MMALSSKSFKNRKLMAHLHIITEMTDPGSLQKIIELNEENYSVKEPATTKDPLT